MIKVVGDSKQLEQEDLSKAAEEEEEESNTSSMILDIDLPNFILFMVQFTKEQQMKLQAENLSDRSIVETKKLRIHQQFQIMKNPNSQSSNNHNFLSVGADISKGKQAISISFINFKQLQFQHEQTILFFFL